MARGIQVSRSRDAIDKPVTDQMMRIPRFHHRLPHGKARDLHSLAKIEEQTLTSIGLFLVTQSDLRVVCNHKPRFVALLERLQREAERRAGNSQAASRERIGLR